GRLQSRPTVRSGLGQLPVLDLFGPGAFRFTLLLAIRVDEGVGENAVQPRLEVRSRFELMERTESLGEGLLNEVLGIRGISGHPQCRGVELIEKRKHIPQDRKSARLNSSHV